MFATRRLFAVTIIFKFQTSNKKQYFFALQKEKLCSANRCQGCWFQKFFIVFYKKILVSTCTALDKREARNKLFEKSKKYYFIYLKKLILNFNIFSMFIPYFFIFIDFKNRFILYLSNFKTNIFIFERHNYLYP